MKLIIAIVRDEDSTAVADALINQGFRVTRIASTGGFFRRGSTTLMAGVDDEQVDTAIELVRDNCGPITDPGSKRATLFVLNVASFQQV
ncbi:MAG: cyclic-di-AMP receptor [Anaerolineales bacterium]|jgi:uncharacterized protein YaaQ